MTVETPAHPPTAAGSTEDDRRREEAERYVHQLRAFFIHATVFAGGMAIIFVVNLATNAAAGITGEWWAWWSAWALMGWGLAVAIHGLVVRLSRPGNPTSAWEQGRADEILASWNTESAS